MGVVGRLDQYASMLAWEFDDYSMSENLVTATATDFNYPFNNQIISTANDVAPNGLTVLCKHDLTGGTQPFLNCRADLTLTAGTYTMSMYLKGTTSYSASFAFVGETTSEIYSNTANITTTWQRFTLTFTLVATQTASRLQLFFSTQGEGKVVSVWGAQLERGSVATDYTSRPSGTAINRVLASTTNTNITGLGTYYSSGFDENTSITTLVQTGENLLTYSEQFNDASWFKNNYNVTANATTAPDGTLTADKLIAINASTFHDLFKSPGLSSNTYTLSIFAKAAEQSFIQLRIDDGVLSRVAMFNLSTGSVSSSSNVTSPTITSYPNGWYRCSITVTTNIINVVFNGFPTSSNATYSGDGVSGVFIWGAQFERSSVATDYIPTTTTTGSRSLPSPILALSANVFAPYDPVYDEFSGTSFGAGQGRYMRQNTDKSVIVYNEIDEITDLFGRGIVRDGLVLDLDAGITASYPGSGTTWTDLSASGNNGTLINGLTYSSANGGSIVFDGSNDTVRIPISASLQSANFTFDIWVRSNVTSGDQMFFSSHYESFGTPSGIRSGISNEQATRLYYFVTYFNGSYEYTGGGLPDPSSNTNVWINVVGTWDGTNRKRYFNSTFQGLQNVAGEIHSQLNDFYLGNNADTIANNNYTNSVLNGSIAAFKFYNRALSAAEITQNYNALKHRFGL